MHTALWVTGLNVFFCFVLTVILDVMPVKNIDDAQGRDFLMSILVIGGTFFFLLWLALVVVKAAMA